MFLEFYCFSLFCLYLPVIFFIFPDCCFFRYFVIYFYLFVLMFLDFS